MLSNITLQGSSNSVNNILSKFGQVGVSQYQQISFLNLHLKGNQPLMADLVAIPSFTILRQYLLLPRSSRLTLGNMRFTVANLQTVFTKLFGEPALKLFVGTDPKTGW